MLVVGCVARNSLSWCGLEICQRSCFFGLFWLILSWHMLFLCQNQNFARFDMEIVMMLFILAFPASMGGFGLYMWILLFLLLAPAWVKVFLCVSGLEELFLV